MYSSSVPYWVLPTPNAMQFKAIQERKHTSDKSCTADLPGVLYSYVRAGASSSFTNHNQSSHTQETTKPTRQGSSNWQRMTHVALHERQAGRQPICVRAACSPPPTRTFAHGVTVITGHHSQLMPVLLPPV